jgi:hypothetical protein
MPGSEPPGGPTIDRQKTPNATMINAASVTFLPLLLLTRISLLSEHHFKIRIRNSNLEIHNTAFTLAGVSGA